MEDETLKEREDDVSRVYELGYLLAPTIKEENVSVVYGNLKELVISLDGKIITDEMPKMINLAYLMQKVISNTRSKFNTAYFGWTKFAAGSQKVLKIKEHLDLDPNFIRFLILKTVKENTIAAKRFAHGEIYKKPKLKNSENKTTILVNKEEIDKEIDALVAV